MIFGDMFESCLKKQQQIQETFRGCKTREETYHRLIEMGRNLPKISQDVKKPENLVQGCQSTTYLVSSLKGGRLLFEGESDALISAGLVSLLIAVYHDEVPETVLKCPPTYLENLEIASSLTPNRANGLYQIHLKMQQEALQALLPNY